MNDLRKGLEEAIIGIITGIVVIAIMNAFLQDDLIPQYFAWVFGIALIIGNVAAIKKYLIAAPLYLLTWVIGSFLLIDLLDPLGIVINIAAPIAILIARIWLYIKGSISDA